MSKKRVHEIAKEHGLSSKELLERLQAAGVSAKAAASSVEEADALRVLAGNGASAGATATATATKSAPPANGAPTPSAAPTTPAQSAPSGQAASSRRRHRRPSASVPRGDAGHRCRRRPAEGAAAEGTVNPDGAAGQAAGERVRPTRDSRTGERTPASNSAGGRRRVVIDSQASRRQQGGPANQPVRRPRRGRRRRGTYDETIAPIDTTAMEATD